jgi:hypothetical protein
MFTKDDAERLNNLPVRDNRDSLRPVGSIVEIVYPPSLNSSGVAFTKWTYRIKAHSLVANNFAYAEYAETLDPIEDENWQPTIALWLGDSYQWVPPSKWLEIMGQPWKNVHAAAKSAGFIVE